MLDTFSELGESPSLEKIIRQFSLILEIFFTKTANLSSEKIEQNLALSSTTRNKKKEVFQLSFPFFLGKEI